MMVEGKIFYVHKPMDNNILKYIDIVIKTSSENNWLGGKILDNVLCKLLFQEHYPQLRKLQRNFSSDAALRNRRDLRFALVTNTIKLHTAANPFFDSKISYGRPSNKPEVEKC
eukprot:snap_masked-scaffold_1-processed-gene-16.81-mRNA-1 protein AED:1.00 eAED:1.00 QI:0/-1/0/0/-1/1/1/0/112